MTKRPEETYYELINEIDKALILYRPGEEALANMPDLTPGSSVQRYFFHAIQDPDWLPVLKQQDFFNDPPHPMEDTDSGRNVFPEWAASRCLARFADTASTMVKDIIIDLLKAEEITNGRIIADFLDAAVNMPPSEAADISAVIRDVSVFPPRGYHEPRIGRLIQKLAEGGEGEEALALAGKVLVLKEYQVEDAKPVRWQPQSILDDHAYNVILADVFPSVVAATGVQALELLCDLLHEAFAIFERGREGIEDFSHIRRPAIEDNPMNLGYSLEDSLIDATRDAADQLLMDETTPPSEVFEILDGYEHKIFERIKLHLLAEHPNSAPEKVRDALLNKDDKELMQYPGSLAHEYYELLEAGFPLLDSDEEKVIFNRIRDGLDTERRVENYTRSRREAPPEEMKQRWVEDWQYKRLCRLPETNLPDDLRELYERMAEDRSPEEEGIGRPRFEWVEGEKGRTEDELLEMEVPEVWEFLRQWEPQETMSLPYREQAAELQEAISTKPQRFVTQLTPDRLPRPEYASAILRGLTDACKEGERFDWEPVLDVCQAIVSKPVSDAESEVWRWCKQEVGDLLKSGLREGPAEVPLALREDVWSCIEPLTHHAHPQEDREMGLPEPSQELPTQAINSVRGRAFQAVLWYGQWCAGYLLDDERPGDRNIFEDQIPEVCNALEERLDPEKEKSLAIHSLFGMHFRFLWWLDKTWVKENLDRIFPKGPAMEARWWAAWEAYLNFTGRYLDLIELLKDHYKLALSRLKDKPSDEVSAEGPAGKVAEHIVAVYIWGYEELDSPLLENLYALPHSSVRAHIASFLSRYIDSGGDEVEPEHFERVYDLWEWCLDELKDQEPAQRQEEAESFGWLFTIHRLEPKRSLELFEQALGLSDGNTECLGEVMEYLAKRADIDPRKAVEALKLILKGKPEDWELWEIARQARPILKAAKTSGDEDSADIADECINMFGESGIDDFREMLNSPA